MQGAELHSGISAHATSGRRAARLCASAADRETLVDAEIAEAVKDRRSLKGLGNRAIRGYDQAMPVFGISFDEPSSFEPKTNGLARDV